MTSTSESQDIYRYVTVDVIHTFLSCKKSSNIFTLSYRQFLGLFR
jgi:hypothetical protein